MNIYLVEWHDGTTYDAYDSMVVYANTEEEAKKIHPSGDAWDDDDPWEQWILYENIDQLSVTFLGTNDNETEQKVILASYTCG